MLELEHGFRIVDVHARLHAGPEPPLRGRDVDAEGLERELHQAGVVRAAVFPGEQANERGYLRANNAVARQTVERPFVALARIDGPRDPGTDAASRLRNLRVSRESYHTDPDDVEQYAYDDRFHGFRLHPPRDGLPDAETLDALGDADLPVLVHAGRDFPPETVADTLLDRGFPVILGHFGGHPLDRDAMADALALLDRYDGLYLDTSAVRYRDILERGITEHPDRVVFGSGTPSVHPDVAVMEILTLDVPEDLMGRVFSKNPGRVIDALRE
ncbi:amidohydrolase family protein [Salarchaeum sp. JOR-1]|uniref:amidohydrolase family protein n=1 Tax=Salarchaeum sp. JOR-1 TaxID=2599399 RepID=UPI0011987B50|nr:amidohydrolase family protein [Salarchaeum sp. JOR-1]QDX39776.1 amidohydrolase family protein [Salarchaeum sp. JOR-1]